MCVLRRLRCDTLPPTIRVLESVVVGEALNCVSLTFVAIGSCNYGVVECRMLVPQLFSDANTLSSGSRFVEGEADLTAH